jgi:hypothetical protein
MLVDHTEACQALLASATLSFLFLLHCNSMGTVVIFSIIIFSYHLMYADIELIYAEKQAVREDTRNVRAIHWF